MLQPDIAFVRHSSVSVVIDFKRIMEMFASLRYIYNRMSSTFDLIIINIRTHHSGPQNTSRLSIQNIGNIPYLYESFDHAKEIMNRRRGR